MLRDGWKRSLRRQGIGPPPLPGSLSSSRLRSERSSSRSWSVNDQRASSRDACPGNCRPGRAANCCTTCPGSFSSSRVDPVQCCDHVQRHDLPAHCAVAVLGATRRDHWRRLRHRPTLLPWRRAHRLGFGSRCRSADGGVHRRVPEGVEGGDQTDH